MSQPNTSLRRVAGRRVDWWILLPPAVALGLFAAGNDNFGFPPPGFLDAFVYIGYFWHYPEHLAIFENYYKSSRLPWILPGFVAFRAFGEIAGSYLLHWLTLSIGGAAMYLLLRDTLKDKVVSAVVGVAWVCSTAGHGAGGWNYHALAGVTYYVLGCWLIVRAASSKRLAGALGGAAFACAVHTYSFYVSLAPLVLWLFIAARPRDGRGGWRHLALDLASVPAGALAVTALLGLVNAATGGPWLFFMVQLQTTLDLTKPGSDAWWFETGRWLPTAGYLVVPVVSLCAAAAVPLFRSAVAEVQRLRLTFALQSWVVLAIFSYAYFVHHFGVLNYDYMSLGVYAHAFPALAAMLCGEAAGDSRPRRASILAGAFLLIPGALLLGLPLSMTRLSQHLAAIVADLAPIVPPLALGILGVVAGLALPRRLAVVAFAAWFSIVNSWTTTSAYSYGIGNPGIHREMLRVFRDMDRFATRLDPTLGSIEYWFTGETIDTPQGPIDLAWVFDSFVSTRGWSGNLLAGQSPGLPIEQLTPMHLLTATCLGVLSSVGQHEAVRTQFLMHTERTGPSLRKVEERQFRSTNLALALTIYRVEKDGETVTPDGKALRPPCQP